MTIKIVTDSTVDLPVDIIRDLGVTVVAEYLRFGDQVYRDQIDISEDEFYQRLTLGHIHPNTAQPTPQDFANVYKSLAKETKSIISIHLSSKLSGTFNSAQQAKNLIDNACQIEVVDSQSVSIAMGLVVMHAAEMARSGLELKHIVEELERMKENTHMLILFDTLKYLSKGGRIGKGKALLGSLLNVKPLLMIKDGELLPSGQVRTRSKGKNLLVDFAKNHKNIQDLAVLYSTTPDEAQEMVELITPIFSKAPIILARLGPALGVHGGPGVLAVALRTAGA
jgi:DegV family protein with EDD domain